MALALVHLLWISGFVPILWLFGFWQMFFGCLCLMNYNGFWGCFFSQLQSYKDYNPLKRAHLFWNQQCLNLATPMNKDGFKHQSSGFPETGCVFRKCLNSAELTELHWPKLHKHLSPHKFSDITRHMTLLPPWMSIQQREQWQWVMTRGAVMVHQVLH